jgi:DNA processing protein
MDNLEWNYYRVANLSFVGPRTLIRLMDKFETLDNILNADEIELMEFFNDEDKVADFIESVNSDNLKRDYDRLKAMGIRIIYQGHPDYPKKLESLYDAPICLYLRGKLPDPDQKSVAIIGARQASYYGLEMAKYFGRELAKKDVAVISGLAYGADAKGHVGALEVGGYTLGILGSGINLCYPKENYHIYSEMIIKGGVMSESGLDVKPHAGLFPLRNRLIAAMSDGILVTEAREKSGTLITVDQGLELGKDIFAIPGRNGDPLSLGCNRLIKSGAKLVTNVDDILEEWAPIDDSYEEISIHKDVKLSTIDKKVYHFLTLEPVFVDRIIEMTHLSVSDVLKALMRLEKRGLIVQSERNYFAVVL